MKTSEYEKEYLAIRFAVMAQSSDSKIKVEGYRNLIESCKSLGWAYHLDDLIRSAKADSSVSSGIGNLIVEYSSKKPNLGQCDPADSYFSRLNLKDIQSQSSKIKEFATLYFNNGYFSQYNVIFTKFIKNLREINPMEMNSFIVKFFISSAMKKNYDNAINDIQYLKQYYPSYDLNIYIYLLNFISGNFNESANYILSIGQNIYSDVYDLCTQEDLVNYFTISMMVNFKRHILREVPVQSSSLVNKLFDENPRYSEVLENFSKCRYNEVIAYLEKMLNVSGTDPFLVGYRLKLNFEIKHNIIKEIISCSSVVSIDYLSSLLKEKPDLIENWILSGNSEGYYKIRLDDINKIVYTKSRQAYNDTLNKTLNFAKESYNTSIKICTSKLKRTIEMKRLELEGIKAYSTGKGGAGMMDLLRGAGIAGLGGMGGMFGMS